MTRTSKWWLPAIAGTRKTAMLLGLSAIAAAGALMLNPSTAHASAPIADPAPPAAPAPPPAPLDNALGRDPMLQINGYFCAPASTRIALSAHGLGPSQDELAAKLGTTTAGTNSVFEVSRVLNEYLQTDRYKVHEIPNQAADQGETDQLVRDVVQSINHNDSVIANVVGSVVDENGDVHSYMGGHYVAITGYYGHGATYKVTDPADRDGDNEYLVRNDHMADWIASRGYTAS